MFVLSRHIVVSLVIDEPVLIGPTFIVPRRLPLGGSLAKDPKTWGWGASLGLGRRPHGEMLIMGASSICERDFDLSRELCRLVFVYEPIMSIQFSIFPL